MNAPLITQKRILKHFSVYDPVMAGMIRKIGAFGLKRHRNYFQLLCRAIISQQISTRAALAVGKRFMNLFNGKTPTPARVLVLKNEILRGAGLSRQKVSYVKDLSRHFAEKIIRPHSLRYLSNEEVIFQLTSVRGIGRWTAEMFLIFSLNRLDILPVDDLGLRVALKNIYHFKEVPSVKKIRKLAKPWHPYESVATWYAWRSLDSKTPVY